MLALDRHDLARLAADRGELRLSLFLPTRQREPLRRRSRVRGKNLVHQAGRLMAAHGYSSAHTSDVVDSALDILDET